MAGPTNGWLVRRLTVDFALCLALSVVALPSKGQVTSAPEIPVKAVIYTQVFTDAIRLHAANVIAVAILSSKTFDSTQIDPESLTLAAPTLNLIGTSNAAICQEGDANGDGLVDLLCQFELGHLPIKSGFSMAVLQGKTTDGIGIRAEVPVNIVPDPSLQGPSGAPRDPEMPR